MVNLTPDNINYFMANNWLDIALTQLGKTYQSSGAFVAFVMNTSNIKADGQTGHWSQDLIDLLYDVYELNTVENTRPGDLLFWGIPEQPYSVGIYVGGSHYIAVDENDAQVKIQTLNQSWYPTFAGTVL